MREPVDVPDGIAYELVRVRTRDGGDTTVYLVRHPIARTRLSLLCFPETARLDQWCAAEGHAEAIVAGFFLRDPYRPLGEVRIGARWFDTSGSPRPGGRSGPACTSTEQ